MVVKTVIIGLEKKPFYKIKKGKVKYKLGAFYITIMELLWDDYETFILLLRDY